MGVVRNTDTRRIQTSVPHTLPGGEQMIFGLCLLVFLFAMMLVMFVLLVTT
jgi:hypothetical protein